MNGDREFDRFIEGWLSEPSPELEDRVLREVADRLPDTPQRRGWWPLRRFPLGIGAINRPAAYERSGSMEVSIVMTNLGRIAVLAVIVGILGAFVYTGLFEPFTGPQPLPGASAPSPSAEPSGGPASSPSPAPTPDPAVGVRVTGTSFYRIEDMGTDVDGHLRDRHTWAMYLQMDDPRLMGESDFLMNADDYGGVGPEWGTLRFFDDEGSWEGQVGGYFWTHATNLAGYLTGAGAYEGLTLYIDVLVDNYAASIQYEGTIFPGPAPSDVPLP